VAATERTSDGFDDFARPIGHAGGPRSAGCRATVRSGIGSDGGDVHLAGCLRGPAEGTTSAAIGSEAALGADSNHHASSGGRRSKRSASSVARAGRMGWRRRHRRQVSLRWLGATSGLALGLHAEVDSASLVSENSLPAVISHPGQTVAPRSVQDSLPDWVRDDVPRVLLVR